MKEFAAPEVMVIYFKNDVIVASPPCECNECPGCPEGSNDCPCVDSWTSDYGKP